MNRSKSQEKKWYKVDNLALVYTATRDQKSENVFRLAVIMKEKVKPKILQQAFEITMRRFPYFSVKVKRGFFWNYFEQNLNPMPNITYDIYDPTRPINTSISNDYHLRVLYYEKRISLEIFHGLCDGYGASFLLQTLVANYLRLLSHIITPGFGVLEMDEEIDPQEYEDAYIKYGRTIKSSGSRKGMKEGRVYRNKGRFINRNQHIDIVTGILPLDKCLTLARKNNVTLTEYITAVLMYILYNKQKNEIDPLNKKQREYPIRAALPVNCRPYFPTKTLRNFFLVVNPIIYPNISDYTFKQILKEIKAFMGYHINSNIFLSEMAGNIQTETNILARPVPLFLKKRVITTFYKYLGEKHNSIKISNVGNFKVPKEMEEHIERTEVIMGRPLSETLQVGILSFLNNLSITFNSIIIEKDIEREFFRHFVDLGIEVEIESNVR